MKRAILSCAFAVAALGLPGACSRDDHSTTTQPAPASAPAAPALTLLHDGWQAWSREEAVDHLLDAKQAVSAAVRLARLAEVATPLLPDPLTDAEVRRLAVEKVGDTLWALGERDFRQEGALLNPLLLTGTGVVILPPTERGAPRLHVSPDPDVFPHLLVAPHAVARVELPLADGLVLQPLQAAWFELRSVRGRSYIALIAYFDGRIDEIAKYQWDPYELTFMGPLADEYGGEHRFELLLGESPLLTPRGGEVPEVGPTRPAPPGPEEEEPDTDPMIPEEPGAPA